MNRYKHIVRVSVVGIVVNLLLGLMKIIIGLSSNSIAIISDAVNNFTDSVTSFVTIITIKIASKGATKSHPFGFGRVEYFSGAIVSVIVIVTGLEFLGSSWTRIFNPGKTEFSIVSIVILLIAVLTKVLLGRYTKAAGNEENAPTLIASGQDALVDAVITSVTLLGALLTLLFKINIDGYLGVFVSLLLLKTGIEMLWEIISSLLGQRNEVELAQKIVKELKSTEGIMGAYDLILHNYGPNIYIGDVNVELEDKMTVKEAYILLKPIKHFILETYGVVLFIGFYPVNTTDEAVMKIEKRVKEIGMSHPQVLQIHAFIISNEHNLMAFDIVVDFDCKDVKTLKAEVIASVSKEFNQYRVKATTEKDFSFSE